MFQNVLATFRHPVYWKKNFVLLIGQWTLEVQIGLEKYFIIFTMY